MKTNAISINVLVDSSGSMESIAADMAGSLNHFIAENRKFDAAVTYSTFADEYQPVFADLPIKKVRKFTFTPGGTTALIESACKMIDEVGERLGAMPESDRPEKVMFIIITDGCENASAPEYTRKRLFAKIKEQTEVYNWLFLYFGANQDAIATAANYGIAADHAVDWQASAQGAMRNSRRFSRALDRVASAGAFAMQSCVFDAEDRAE